MKTPRRITRKQASLALRDWEAGLRNYEIEQGMASEHGGQWIVSEWCPFNGIFCAYRDVASVEDIETARRNITKHGPSKGLNVEYHLKYLETGQ